MARKFPKKVEFFLLMDGKLIELRNCPASHVGSQRRGTVFPQTLQHTGAKRREWMRMGVAGMIITSDYESFPHSLLSLFKQRCLKKVGSK